MCLSVLLRPRESRHSPGGVIFPPTLEGGAPADTPSYPPHPSREGRWSPLWISAVKFAEKNVKFCTGLVVHPCGKFTEIEFPQIPATCLSSASMVWVCSDFFISDVVFIGALMHFFISSIKLSDIVSFPEAFGGRACRSEPFAHL